MPGSRWLSLDGGKTELEAQGTVLIADDDDDLREVIVMWLLDDQWEVLEAKNGREALERLDGTVDILLLDRRMPKLSGPEVAERLSETAFEGVVIVVSAYESDERLSETDVTNYITKPVEHDQFLTQLHRAVR